MGEIENVRREQIILDQQTPAVRRVYRLFTAAVGFARNTDPNKEIDIQQMVYRVGDFLAPLDNTIYRLMFDKDYLENVYEADISRALSIQMMLKKEKISDLLHKALPAILLIVPILDQSENDTEASIERIKASAVEKSQSHLMQTAPLGSTKKRYVDIDREALAKSLGRSR